MTPQFTLDYQVMHYDTDCGGVVDYHSPAFLADRMHVNGILSWTTATWTPAWTSPARWCKASPKSF